MAIIRGEPPRPRWLPRLLMASLVLIGVVLGRPSGQPAVCSWSCCSVMPSCEYAYRVTCDCAGFEKMTFRKEDIPASASEVTVHNAGHVIVEEDAIGDLSSLVNFTVSDVGQLEIRPGGMASTFETRPRSFNFFRIVSLKIEKQAFSGHRQLQPTIWFNHIRHLDIESKAFEIPVEKLTLQHVRNSALGPRGFSEKVQSVTLHDVFINKCHRESFGQNSSFVEWTNVTIDEARPGCYGSFTDEASFSAQGLTVNFLKPKTFAGHLQRVIISDSHLYHWDENAFDLQVTRMTLRNLTVETLNSHSLRLRAKGPVDIDHVHIRKLKREAFSAIDLAPGAQAQLFFNYLKIYSAEKNSLALSKTVIDNLHASLINVKSSHPRICPVEKSARMLIGADFTDSLTSAQSILVGALNITASCDFSVSDGSEFVQGLSHVPPKTTPVIKSYHGPDVVNSKSHKSVIGSCSSAVDVVVYVFIALAVVIVQ